MTARSESLFLAPGVLLLSFLLNLYRILPSASLLWALVPTLELFAMMAVIATSSLFLPGNRIARVIAVTATSGAGTVLAAWSFGEGALQMLYARAWEPVGDFPLIRSAVILLFPGEGALAGNFAVAFLVTGVVLLFALHGIVFLVLSRLCARERKYEGGSRGHAVAVGAALLVAVMLLGTTLEDEHQSLSATVVQGLKGDDFALDGGSRQPGGEPAVTEDSEPQDITGQDESTDPDPDPAWSAPGFRNRDIYVFIIESYGITIFENDEIREALLPRLEQFERELSNAGFHGVSNFIEAPIFGGQSWLSEATFLTGNQIDRQGRYEQLLQQGSETVLDYLADLADYYAVAVKPGMINGAWPEGREVLGFSEVMSPYYGDFGYQGPWFSFVPIPDQYAIWKAHERIQQIRESEHGDRPLYMHYQLVSSHTPFNRIPEFFKDWSKLGDGSLYHDSATQYFDNDYLQGSEYVEGYIASIEYVLDTLEHYMARKIDSENESLFIIYGDHQPGSMVTGRGASNSVPIHIVSRDRELLDAWRNDYDYIDGYLPTQDYPHTPMSEMFNKISSVASRPVYAQRETSAAYR